MNRRNFLSKLGLFSIFAPTAGARIWKAARNAPSWTPDLMSQYNRLPYELMKSRQFQFLPSFQDFLAQNDKLVQRIDGDELFKPTVWPANMGDVHRVIERTVIEPIPPGLFRQTHKPLTIDDIIR